MPNDALELAEKSGLGDELWAIYGARIMRKFEPVDGNGRLRNDVCFEEWQQAQAAYLKRARAAEKTNTSRPSKPIDGHRTVTARSPSINDTVTVKTAPEPKIEDGGKKTLTAPFSSESATVTVDKPPGDRTGTVYGPVDVYVPVDVLVLPEELEKPIDSSMFASAVLTECRIGGRNLRMVLEEVGNAEQSHGENLGALAAQAVRSWNEYGAVKSQLKYQWSAEKFFGEGHWNHPENWPRKDSDVYANFSLGLSDDDEAE